MFKSNNVDNMNVTTIQFEASGLYLTVVTRDDKPWDGMMADSLEAANENHLAMLLACGLLNRMVEARNNPMNRDELS